MSRLRIYDHEVLIGDAYQADIVLYDETGSRHNIVGATAEAEARDPQGLAVAEPSVEITDAAGGGLTVSIPSTETAGWSPGVYAVGVRLTYLDGSRYTIYEARLHVRRGPVQ